MIVSSRNISLIDKFAVSASTICATHCICLPFLLGVFPAIGTTLFGEEVFQVWLLWAVIPSSLVAISLGCYKHKDRAVLVIGLLGLIFLIIAASLGHDMLGEEGERITTLMGAITIAAGHLRNYKLCRRYDYNH